jgi:hypothetical protein
LKEKATGSDEKALCGQERRDGDAKRWREKKQIYDNILRDNIHSMLNQSWPKEGEMVGYKVDGKRTFAS